MPAASDGSVGKRLLRAVEEPPSLGALKTCGCGTGDSLMVIMVVG